MMIKRILVPTDFSYTSLRALEYAIDFARPFKAELVVLFVVEIVRYATPGDLYAPGANLAMLMGEQERVGREQLARLAADLKKRRVPARTVLATGVPYQLIVATAKKVKADLIIMATHGRSGLSHMLMGSVAEKVVRSAECPVVTVGHHKAGGRRQRRGTGRQKRK